MANESVNVREVERLHDHIDRLEERVTELEKTIVAIKRNNWFLFWLFSLLSGVVGWALKTVFHVANK